MTLEASRSNSSGFWRAPQVAGAIMFLLGAVFVALSFALGDTGPWIRIGGLAVLLLGILTLGFGLLVQVQPVSFFILFKLNEFCLL